MYDTLKAVTRGETTTIYIRKDGRQAIATVKGRLIKAETLEEILEALA